MKMMTDAEKTALLAVQLANVITIAEEAARCEGIEIAEGDDVPVWLAAKEALAAHDAGSLDEMKARWDAQPEV